MNIIEPLDQTLAREGKVMALGIQRDPDGNLAIYECDIYRLPNPTIVLVIRAFDRKTKYMPARTWAAHFLPDTETSEDLLIETIRRTMNTHLAN